MFYFEILQFWKYNQDWLLWFPHAYSESKGLSILLGKQTEGSIFDYINCETLWLSQNNACSPFGHFLIKKKNDKETNLSGVVCSGMQFKTLFIVAWKT